MREGDQKKPSVQRLMPDSSSSKTKTAPDAIMRRSASTRRRVTRGMRPRRAASRMRSASRVVSIHPHQGGSVHVVPLPLPLDGARFWLAVLVLDEDEEPPVAGWVDVEGD